MSSVHQAYLDMLGVRKTSNMCHTHGISKQMTEVGSALRARKKSENILRLTTGLRYICRRRLSEVRALSNDRQFEHGARLRLDSFSFVPYTIWSEVPYPEHSQRVMLWDA